MPGSEEYFPSLQSKRKKGTGRERTGVKPKKAKRKSWYWIVICDLPICLKINNKTQLKIINNSTKHVSTPVHDMLNEMRETCLNRANEVDHGCLQ